MNRISTPTRTLIAISSDYPVEGATALTKLHHVFGPGEHANVYDPDDLERIYPGFKANTRQ